MKIIASIIILLFVAVGGHYWLGLNKAEAPATMELTTQEEVMEKKTLPTITPISHATFVLEWSDLVVYNDPVGGVEAFAGQKPADIVLVSDIHGDHFNLETLEAVVGPDTTLIVPKVVADELPQTLADKALTVVNGQLIRNEVQKIDITAVPMYNLPDPEAETLYHEEGRGNGYVLKRDGVKIYIAGDTAATPEMKDMRDVDVAFIPMNLPYTMSVEEAAEGVIAFNPTQVYPYHYRGTGGLSDVAKFKELVNAAAPDVEVVQLDWYPE